MGKCVAVEVRVGVNSISIPFNELNPIPNVL
jgi:hypothetical protein